MILVIDNKDSFVWNLASYAAHYDDVEVLPNDTDVGEILGRKADGIIISPGPGSPDKPEYVGNVPSILEEAKCPILGVCLGHQIMAHHYGGLVGRVAPLHGKASRIYHDEKAIYEGISNPIQAGRYHSLAVIRPPEGFTVTAKVEDGTIMGIRSEDGRLEGVQFHPESILTDPDGMEGLKIIENFVKRCLGE
ncbi:MAG: aminodeoxychorismate/anthranilate synthase component II [Candidatus Methanofastidiosa archaeon]|nr:aminodeoxychorismate/anthranilate synthase component II [Candidatus Methanofastidiosa archaeon]